MNLVGSNKSEAGPWRRRKGPAPKRPQPVRRVVGKCSSVRDLQQQLRDIEVQQTELERQGVLLEQCIRIRSEQQEAWDAHNVPPGAELEVVLSEGGLKDAGVRGDEVDGETLLMQHRKRSSQDTNAKRAELHEDGTDISINTIDSLPAVEITQDDDESIPDNDASMTSKFDDTDNNEANIDNGNVPDIIMNINPKPKPPRIATEKTPNVNTPNIDLEDMIMQLFEIVNHKNELFRRQTELMYL